MNRKALAWCIALLAGLALAGEALALEPARGRLLVATPRLVDSNFSQTVVLLLDYGDRGAEGLVLNRASRVRPARVLPEIRELADYRGTLYFGGPVELNGLLVLLRDADRDDDELEEVLDGVAVTSDIRVLREAAGRGLGPDALRLYAGRAGWMPGQLEYELRRKAWVVMEASPALVFAPEPESLWNQLVPATRPLRANRTDRIDYADRADRADDADRADYAARADRTVRIDRTDYADYDDRAARLRDESATDAAFVVRDSVALFTQAGIVAEPLSYRNRHAD